MMTTNKELSKKKVLSIRPHCQNALPVLAVGILAFVYALFVEPVAILLAAPLGIAGILGLLPRVTINLEKESVIKCGWLPCIRHAWALEQFDRIYLLRKDFDQVRFAVGLASQSGSVELFGSVEGYPTARRYAGKLQFLLRMEIYDSALGNLVVHLPRSKTKNANSTSRYTSIPPDDVDEFLDSVQHFTIHDQVTTRDRITVWLFFVIGIVALCGVFWDLATKGKASVLIAMSAIMLLLLGGLCWLNSRSGVAIDSTNGRIRRWHFFYRLGRWKSFSGFDAVTLAAPLRYWFTVAVDGPEGYLVINCFKDRDEALQFANRVARIGRFELRDFTASKVD